MAQAGGGVTICITDCCCSWGLWWGKGGQHKGSFLPSPLPNSSFPIPSSFLSPCLPVSGSRAWSAPPVPPLMAQGWPCPYGPVDRVLLPGSSCRQGHRSVCGVKIKPKGRPLAVRLSLKADAL